MRSTELRRNMAVLLILWLLLAAMAAWRGDESAAGKFSRRFIAPTTTIGAAATAVDASDHIHFLAVFAGTAFRAVSMAVDVHTGARRGGFHRDLRAGVAALGVADRHDHWRSRFRLTTW